jgi:hypothetical protein
MLTGRTETEKESQSVITMRDRMQMYNIYIHTLNVSCIMLVYYFVPFIVSNRYLLL